MTFERWLSSQVGRDDEVGDFAKFVQNDPKHPRSCVYTKWISYLRGHGGTPEERMAFKASWREWQERKPEPEKKFEQLSFL